MLGKKEEDNWEDRGGEIWLSLGEGAAVPLAGEGADVRELIHYHMLVEKQLGQLLF